MMSRETAILIVDDDPVGRMMLEAMLASDGYRLIAAAAGAEALALAAADPPDLVLLDVMMPGMDGYEVCRRLRADPLLGEVPIILLTALDDRASRLAGIEAGADDFISKPFDRVELRMRIRTIARLNRYRRLVSERAMRFGLIEFMPDGLLITNAEGRLLLINPAALRLLAIPDEDQLRGQFFADYVAPAERDACAERLRAVAATPAAVDRFAVMLGAHQQPAELHIGQLTWVNRPAVQIIARAIIAR